MIHVKNGGVSSYKKLCDLRVKPGDTFISKDGTVLVIVKPSCYVFFIRLDGASIDTIVPGEATISQMDLHHTFKCVEVDLTIRAVKD